MRGLPKKVVILGSAALKIGEAGEFDYSGSQAIKAFKEEGVQVVLVNPNIATIQTSEHLADRVYFLPVDPYFVEKVLQREQPDAIALSFGGQTALNCGLALHKNGVLDRMGIRVLGTPIDTVADTEDRQRFVERLREMNVCFACSEAVDSLPTAQKVAEKLGYPVIVRVAYALGGLGSGLCRSAQELEQLVSRALHHSPQVLVEEYLQGWKEIEYEVVRDDRDNCITVCNMENLDPMGIHTGESIVVAPSQTLNNRQYHLLRQVAIQVVRHLGVVGECNIQFALSPHSDEYRIIEVNARLSRSSALASKATGYPLAFVAAKLALGYALPELVNSVTGTTRAFFEPALDYVVVKLPRWDLKKFRRVSRRLGSGMKSVGEVMAIGRTFEEALQKGLRMLETGAQGLVANPPFDWEDLEQELSEPTEERIFAVAEAFRAGFSVDRVHELTRIDRWFLFRIQAVVKLAESLAAWKLDALPESLLCTAKQRGFSDKQIAILTGSTQEAVRRRRHRLGIRPVVKQIDTLAAEYPARTNYLYLTYNGVEDDVRGPLEKLIVLLGSGAYRIGSSVEFDWCCVSAGRSLRHLGYRTLMLNYNPETVSTDYDEFDVLLFDEIRLETILELWAKFSPLGVVVSMGGQIPNNLALELAGHGIPLLGTSAENIDRAEDRRKFSSLLDELGIGQPPWAEVTSLQQATRFARQVGYPVLVRPSYVLSGAAMAVASNDQELARYLQRAADVSPEHPVVLSKFLENAKEIEYDGVACKGDILAHAISEHVENAGVHSGDATLVIPPQRTYLETIRQIRAIARAIARALQIHGPFNIQFIARENMAMVIECNLRASRSFPFVSKILGNNLIEQATRVMVGRPPPASNGNWYDLEFVGVKAPQFSFTRLEGADPTLGVEMASTGEVACLGRDFNEAFLKALLSVGFRLPIRSVLLSTGSIESKAELLQSVRYLKQLGVRFYATRGTAQFLKSNGIEAGVLHWPLEKKSPGTVEYIQAGKIDLVINIPKNYQEEELTNDYIIRRAAVDYNVPLITNRQLAMRLAEALIRTRLDELEIKSWQEYSQKT